MTRNIRVIIFIQNITDRATCFLITRKTSYFLVGHNTSERILSDNIIDRFAESTVLAAAIFRSHLNFEKTSSIGLESGLYGGR